MGHHFAGKVDHPIAGGLRPDQTAAPIQALTGENTGKFITQFFIHAEQIANLPGTNTDVTCRHIGIRPDMTGQFSHKRLAETHDLPIRPPLGIKVRATLTTTHLQGG